MSLEQYAETHTVTNQPTPLDGSNLYRGDRPLQEWLQRFGASSILKCDNIRRNAYIKFYINKFKLYGTKC